MCIKKKTKEKQNKVRDLFLKEGKTRKEGRVVGVLIVWMYKI